MLQLHRGHRAVPRSRTMSSGSSSESDSQTDKQPSLPGQETTRLLPLTKDETPSIATIHRNKSRTFFVYGFVVVALFTSLGVLFAAASVKFGDDREKVWREHQNRCNNSTRLCKIAGTYQSNLAQFVLPVCISIVLTTSWLTERPRRSFVMFFADNSKSAVAAGVTHFMASGIAALLQNGVSGEGYESECDFYILVFMQDTIMSVASTIALHQYTSRLAAKTRRFKNLARVGQYASLDKDGNEVYTSRSQYLLRWFYQMLHWVFCAIVTRAANFSLILYPLRYQLQTIAVFMGWWSCSESEVNAKVWVVVVILPVFFDAMQFLIQNYFLKADPIKVETRSSFDHATRSTDASHSIQDEDTIQLLGDGGEHGTTFDS